MKARKIQEHQMQHLNELKSEEIFEENKYIFQSMITKMMKKFRLSKDVAVMMLEHALERAANEM